MPWRLEEDLWCPPSPLVYFYLLGVIFMLYNLLAGPLWLLKNISMRKNDALSTIIYSFHAIYFFGGGHTTQHVGS